MIRVLITGGGTSEQIDQVRKITNTSTGRLAKQIFDLMVVNKDYIIDFVGSDNIKFNKEETTRANIYKVNDFNSLQQCMNLLLNNEKYDFIIHAMAISDYYVNAVYDLNDIVKAIIKADFTNEEQLKKVIEKASKLDNSKKLASNYDDLLISMKQTNKIIAQLRTKQPQALIVGCKLLDNVSEGELIQVAQKQIITNKLDFCIANDMKNIYDDTHQALILNKKGEVITKCQNKKEIATEIIQLLKEEDHG